MTELNANKLKEQLENELLEQSIAKRPIREEYESKEDRLLEILGEAHYSSYETENFKSFSDELVWDGDDSESFHQQLIFLHKPSGKHLVLEAWHNSYEYMEYDTAFIGVESEVTFKKWVRE